VHGDSDIGEDASEAHVRLHPDGSALLFSCVTEHGTGQRSNLVKMVAEVLQLELERVSIAPADSRSTLMSSDSRAPAAPGPLELLLSGRPGMRVRSSLNWPHRSLIRIRLNWRQSTA